MRSRPVCYNSLMSEPNPYLNDGFGSGTLNRKATKKSRKET